jgi:hypothetical protein
VSLDRLMGFLLAVEIRALDCGEHLMSGEAVTTGLGRRRPTSDGAGSNDADPHAWGIAGKLNWLRASVLGADDGIVSVAGIVLGVAGATSARGPIFTAALCRWHWESSCRSAASGIARQRRLCRRS